MKIVSAFKAHYDTNYPPNKSTLQKNSSDTVSNRNVSFGSFKSGLTKFVNAVEKKGFFAEFLVIDSLSMILPRILIGLNRDREKTGEVNYKAGLEEAGREVISGPSMFLIPMSILAFYEKRAPASHMSKDALELLTNNMKKIVDEIPDVNLLKDKKYLQKSLADKLFDEAFEGFELTNRENLKATFRELLNKSTQTEPKSLFERFKGIIKSQRRPDYFADAATEFENHVALINNTNKAQIPFDTKNLNLTQNGIDARILFKDFHNYSKDAIKRFSERNFVATGIKSFKDEATTFLKAIQKVRSNLKFATGVTSFLAIGAFLLYLPKLYQQGKVSPAMESAKRARESNLAKGGTNENS